MRLPLKVNVKANAYGLTVSPTATDPTTASVTNGLSSYSTETVTITDCSDLYLSYYNSSTSMKITTPFTFTSEMYFGDSRVASGEYACNGLYQFKCGSLTSEPFYYLSNSLNITPNPSLINNIRTYKTGDSITIPSIDGTIFFTDYPNSATKYIIVSPGTFTFTSTMTFYNGIIVPTGIYFFAGSNGQTSLPFLYDSTTIWQSNYSFPVGGIAVSGGEANVNATFYLEETLTTYKNSSWSKNKSNLVRLPIVWGYKSQSNNDYALFTSSDFPNVTTSWSYNEDYYNNIVSFVTYCIDNGKVVIIDMHTYGVWNYEHLLTDNGTNLSLIWGQTLRIFDQNPVFKNPLVWFELVNEPYDISDFSYYQKTIDQIRSSSIYSGMNNSYTNKIVMGLSAYQHGGHVVINGTTYYHGISDYSGGVPTGTNLCITLHQYFNLDGSGVYGPSMIPNWWDFASHGLSTLSQELLSIVNSKLSGFDFILGEFGYDKDHDPSYGIDAVTHLLDEMVQCNTSKGFTQSSLSTFDYLNQTKGGLWLGFSTWQINSINYSENNAETFTSTYAKYFNSS